MTGRDIRVVARTLAKRDYGPLFLLFIIPIVLQYGLTLLQYGLQLWLNALDNAMAGYAAVALLLVLSELVSVLCLAILLASYRLCGKRAGVEEIVRGRIRAFLLFYLIWNVPSFFINILNSILRFLPTWFQWDSAQVSMWFGVTQNVLSFFVNLFYRAGVQMVLFPTLMLFVCRPDRGVMEAFGEGIPLGFRRWPSIAAFRVRTYLIPTLACLFVSRLVWTAVYSGLAPSIEELLADNSIFGMVGAMAREKALFWANWTGGVVSSVLMAACLPYLRMADMVFFRNGWQKRRTAVPTQEEGG